MSEELKLKPLEELAYWIGVIQTDGCLYKDKNCDSWKINIDVADKSLPMLEKFMKISEKLFGIKGKITRKKNGFWRYHITVTKLLEIFKNSGIEFGDPPRPPEWCKASLPLFCAYLAGVIDGDGSVRTMNMQKYPECVIKISSGHPQEELAECIKTLLNCAVRITLREEVMK